MADAMNPDGSKTGINLDAHITGNPTEVLSGVASANVTVAHTWLIVALALALLWLFGGAIFKSIRM